MEVLSIELWPPTLAHGGVFSSQHTRVYANEKMFRKKRSSNQLEKAM